MLSCVQIQLRDVDSANWLATEPVVGDGPLIMSTCAEWPAAGEPPTYHLNSRIDVPLRNEITPSKASVKPREMVAGLMLLPEK